MKQSDLIKVLKKYLNVELRTIIREEFERALSSPTPEPKRENKSRYVKNDKLNDILMEVNNQHDPHNYDEPETVSFDSKGMTGGNNVIRNKYLDMIGSPISTGDVNVTSVLDNESIPDAVKNALNRDYTSLVKTMNKKK